MNLNKLLGKAAKAVVKAAPAVVVGILVHRATTGKTGLGDVLRDLAREQLNKPDK